MGKAVSGTERGMLPESLGRAENTVDTQDKEEEKKKKKEHSDRSRPQEGQRDVQTPFLKNPVM